MTLCPLWVFTLPPFSKSWRKMIFMSNAKKKNHHGNLPSVSITHGRCLKNFTVFGVLACAVVQVHTCVPKGVCARAVHRTAHSSSAAHFFFLSFFDLELAKWARLAGQ